MRWTIGLDLTPRSAGAINFALWLRETGPDPSAFRLSAAYVLAEPHDTLAAHFALRGADELLELADASLRETLRAAGAQDAVAHPRVVVGSDVEAALAARVAEQHADGLIVGRAGAQERSRLPPWLGPVARRLLRELPGPVMVVPRDWTVDAAAAGPVLVCTDLEPHSASAARFGHWLSGALGRECHHLYVSARVEDSLGMYLPEPLKIGARAEHHRHTLERLTDWRADMDLPDAPCEVVYGNVVDQVLDVATRIGAPMVVCGSRRLSLASRIFRTSIGSALAGASPVPVVVVPEEE